MDDTARVAAALNALALNYNASFAPALLKLWLERLQAFPVDVILQAINRVIDNYEYKTLPPFAVIRKEIGKLLGEPAPMSPETLAEAEWAWLQEQVARRGSWNEPERYPNATTAYVVQSMGGWEHVCSWTIDGLEWRHKDFVELWKRANGRAELMRGGAQAVTTGIMLQPQEAPALEAVKHPALPQMEEPPAPTIEPGEEILAETPALTRMLRARARWLEKHRLNGTTPCWNYGETSTRSMAPDAARSEEQAARRQEVLERAMARRKEYEANERRYLNFVREGIVQENLQGGVDCSSRDKTHA